MINYYIKHSQDLYVREINILITKSVSIPKSYILTDTSNLKKNKTNFVHGVQDAGRYIAKAHLEK